MLLPTTLNPQRGLHAVAAQPRVHLRCTHQLPSRGRQFRIRADDAKATLEPNVWADQGFPSYMQSRVDDLEFCRTWAEEIAQAEKQQSQAAAELSEMSEWSDGGRSLAVWQAIRREALREAAQEPMLSSFLYASILAHDSFERALAFVLSNRLANATMLPTQLFEIFHEVLANDEKVKQGALADVEACRERDPSCGSYSQALLYYKGFHAIQTHRIAHSLWHRGQHVMAIMLQSRVSEVFAVDIHPAARIGCGVLLDHGTGVVIGETAVIGNNCSLLQNVTLGGTGKEVGDRHPKICDNVLIGASATILGNIVIGKGAQIAAGSLVLKPVAPRTMVAGSPASPVGTVSGNPALQMQHWMSKFRDDDDLCSTAAAPAVGAAAAARPDAQAAEGGALAEARPAAEAKPAPVASGSSAPPAQVVDAAAAAVVRVEATPSAASPPALPASSSSGAAPAQVAASAAVGEVEAAPSAAPPAAGRGPPALPASSSSGVLGEAPAHNDAGGAHVTAAAKATPPVEEAAERPSAPSPTTSASPRGASPTPQPSEQPTTSAAAAPPAQLPSGADPQNGSSSSRGKARPPASTSVSPIKAPSYAADSSGWSMALFDEPDYMI